MARYRKKPVEVETLQWTGDNASDVKEFTGRRRNGEDRFLLPEEITGVWDHPHVWADLEQTWVACPAGHYVIRGVHGEFYPCDPDVFAATYEVVN